MGSRSRIALTTVVALLLIGSACSNAPATGAEQSFELFDCEGPIDILDQPPDGWSPILDVMAVPDDNDNTPGRFDAEVGRWFSKFGLVIRADQAFTINVADASQPNALMGWNRISNTPVAAIDIPGCPGVCETDNLNCSPGETGEWIAYPGGFWTLEPACVSLEITSAEQTASHQLSTGAECT